MDNYEQIKELLFKKIEEIINDLYEKYNAIIFEDLYTYEDIVNMSDEQIKNVISNINLDDASKIIANKIRDTFGKEIYKNGEPSIEHIESISKETYNYYRDAANKRIEEENRKNKAEKSKIKNNVNNLKDLITILKQAKIDIEKVTRIIDESILTDEQKQDLNDNIKVYLELKNKKNEEKKRLEEEKRKLEEALKKSKEEVVVEVEDNRLFKINNYEFIEKIVGEYENLFSNFLLELDIEEIFTDNEDLKTILKLHYSDLDEDTFDAAFISILSKIDKSNNKEVIMLYVDILNNLCKKYELINLVNYTDKEIRSFFAYKNLTENETSILIELQDSIREISQNYRYNDKQVDEILNYINDKLHDIKSDRIEDKLNEKDKVEIKSFILFDYKINEEQEKVPYVLSDYDENSTKCQIDKSLDRSKINTNGYKDFNGLIDELIISGKPGILESKNDKLNKLIRPVYFTNGSYDFIKSKMENATGMYRIRPTLNSYLRFIDEKITIDNKSNNFGKIVDLFESKLKDVQIDRNSAFNIYINYLDAFKLDDVESYRIAIKRQSRSSLRELLKKDNLTQGDLNELSEVIDITLDGYNKLKKMNNFFNFKTIDKITKGNNYTP
ncbi:MAG: hypothetical protein IIZ40_01530 [Bacilli bacterium]|nr:hypothetical protein [Bacilli bacterium]